MLAKGLGRCESRDLALRCRQRKERFVVVAANLPATWAKLVHGAFDFLVGAAVRIDMEPLPFTRRGGPIHATDRNRSFAKQGGCQVTDGRLLTRAVGLTRRSVLLAPVLHGKFVPTA